MYIISYMHEFWNICNVFIIFNKIGVIRTLGARILWLRSGGLVGKEQHCFWGESHRCTGSLWPAFPHKRTQHFLIVTRPDCNPILLHALQKYLACYNKYIQKENKPALARQLSGLERRPHTPRLWVWSLVRALTGSNQWMLERVQQQTNVLMFLSLSLSNQ